MSPLAAGDHAVRSAVPRAGAHVTTQVVTLHLVVRAQHIVYGRTPISVHPSPLGPGILEPDLKNNFINGLALQTDVIINSLSLVVRENHNSLLNVIV